MLKIPDGFLDLSPEKAEVFYFVKKKFYDVATLFGFSPIITSSVEFIETFKLSEEKEEFFFNYIDPYEGKPACFRYDFTPQIARFISGKDLSNIYKVFYDGSVLRNEKVLKGNMREIFQAGVEIINHGGLTADKYLINLIKKFVETLRLRNTKIFLNDVNIFRSVVKDAVDIETYKTLKKALIIKDIGKMEEMISKIPIDKKKKEFIINIPFFSGGINIIELVEKKYNFPETRAYLKNLRNIYEETADLLNGELLFDLGEIKGFEYHTGLVIDVYSSDSDNNFLEIITGGRYDNLLKKYTGKDIPATGFAVDLLNLTKALGTLTNQKKVLISSYDNFNRAYDIGERLISFGYKVVMRMRDEPYDEKVFDLIVEIYNNNILIIRKIDGKKLLIDEKVLKNNGAFQESLKEIL